MDLIGKIVNVYNILAMLKQNNKFTKANEIVDCSCHFLLCSFLNTLYCSSV